MAEQQTPQAETQVEARAKERTVKRCICEDATVSDLLSRQYTMYGNERADYTRARRIRNGLHSKIDS
jgi:hypothetical protein